MLGWPVVSSIFCCSNLQEHEKQYLRGQLLQLILEENNQVYRVDCQDVDLHEAWWNSNTCALQIAVQMAVVFAKVARIDYPKAWPTLFTDLLQQLQSQNTLTIRRVYLVLHNSLKELASKRLSSDQKNFAQVHTACRHVCVLCHHCNVWPTLPLAYCCIQALFLFLSPRCSTVLCSPAYVHASPNCTSSNHALSPDVIVLLLVEKYHVLNAVDTTAI